MSSLALRLGTTRRHVPVFALALLLIGVPAAPAPAVQADSSFALYAGPDWRHFFPLDLETLKYRQDLHGFTTESSWTDWAVSADGSTMVVIEEAHTVLVREGLQGSERFRFASADTLLEPRLSGDGSRLLVSVPSECGESTCLHWAWRVYDTSDGRQLLEVQQPNGQLFGALVDRQLHRLYTAVIDGNKEQPGTWPVDLIAFDLNTGVEVARVALPDVTYGARFPRAADGVPIFERWVPAIALSPDGTRLAVVGFDGAAVTLIDTASLSIRATHPIHRDQGALTRTTRWLGLIPMAAEAKTNAGRSLNMEFAPDGRHILLTGFEGSVDETTGEATANGLGLTMIDVESGEIAKRVLDGVYLIQVIPAPDDRNVYVFGPTVIPWTVEDEVPYRLLRLDAESLSIEAEHEFNGPYSILLVPG